MKNKNGIRHVLKNIAYIGSLAWKTDKNIFVCMTLYTLCVTAEPLMAVFTPKFLIDELIGMKRPAYLIGIILVFLLLTSVCGYFATVSFAKYRAKSEYLRAKLKEMLSEKNLMMDFQNTESPNIMGQLQTAQNAVDNWGDDIIHCMFDLFQLFGAALTFVGYIWILMTLHPLIVLFLMINLTVVMVLTIKSKKFYVTAADQIGDLDRKNNYIRNCMNDFSYGKDIRIYRMAPWLAGMHWAGKIPRIRLFREINEHEYKARFADGIFMIFRDILVYAYLVFLVIAKGLSLGNFSLYFSTVANFTETSKQLLRYLINIRTQTQFVDVFREYLAMGDEIKTEHPCPVPQEDVYEIIFDHVYFKYPLGEKYIYEDLSFCIKAGQKLAIVGINGAGKTTLIKLILRLYEPEKGRILLNGMDIREFDREEYWKLFSVVFQEIKMFAFSVEENIALTQASQLDRAKVLESIQMAGLSERIARMEKGCDTQLLKIFEDDGVELSGGESQKLAIARALYKDGKVIIMDEPTAALDAIAEQEIYEKFDELVGGKTAIYISHRLSSTRFCDSITFFENGKVLETGTHDELIALNGKYAHMFRVQAHYYQEGAAEKEGDPIA